MKLGLKSLLFGVHQFLLHPWFVFQAWLYLYGEETLSFPVFVAMVVHDWGYWDKPDMDGPAGETHPVLGARIMSYLFDHGKEYWQAGAHWGQFTLFHSRYYAKRMGATYSRLCVADKMALCMYPKWLYLLLANLSAEIEEYLVSACSAPHERFDALRDVVKLNEEYGGRLKREVQITWHKLIYDYMWEWATEHRDGEPDDVTRAREFKEVA